MGRTCETCERRDKVRTSLCRVFNPKPDNCWAWTDDADWEKKVREQVKAYACRHESYYE